MPNSYVPIPYMQGSPPSSIPTAPQPQYSPYAPVRYAPSIDVPVQYPMLYDPNSYPPPMSNTENIPPMAAPATYEMPAQRPRKRKPDGEHCDAYGNRPRQAMSPMNPSSHLAMQGHVQNYGESRHGTQYNPVEIPSSPECATRAVPRNQTMGETRPALPQDLRQAGLLVQQPNPSERKIKYYAVPGGREPGIYTNWDDVFEQIQGYSGSLQKKFRTEAEAWNYMNANRPYVVEALRRKDQNARNSFNPQSSLNARKAQRTPSPPPSYASVLPTPPSEASRARQVVEQQSHVANSSRPDVSANNYVPEPEIRLSEEQEEVVDLIVNHGKNVFYTGSAGCGKSTILKAFVPLLKKQGKRVRIVAPTNLAALNVGGQTTWNFAGWTPDHMKKPLDKLKQLAHGKEIWKKFDTTDVLVIDEISMIENLQFQRLSEIMRASRAGRASGPFGGVQVIVTGDFCQLAPVKPFMHCMGCGWELKDETIDGELHHACENRACRYESWPDTDKWAFRSKAWQECNFEHINLKKIHRQDDWKFISILQKIRRDGEIVKPHRNILLQHTKETKGAIRIFSKRWDVDRVNKQNIAGLPGDARTFQCVDDFKWNDFEDKTLEKYNVRQEDGTLNQLKDHRYEAVVHLKKDMRVVLQANLQPDAGLVNGTQGQIVGFEEFDPNKLPRAAEGKDDRGELRGTHARYAQGQIKKFADQNRRQPWPIVQFDNGITKTIYADCPCNELGNVGENGDESKLSLLSRAQIPLVAGYAITVHKSQGMTLDRVIVDLKDAFEASQLYVALSRARSLKGLEVVALPTKNLGGANPQVREFFDKYLDKKSPQYPSQTPQVSQPSQ